MGALTPVKMEDGSFGGFQGDFRELSALSNSFARPSVTSHHCLASITSRTHGPVLENPPKTPD